MTTLSNALPSLLVDCFMGGWSDMFGRKLPMFLPALGGVLSSIVYILVVSLPSLGVEWLCLASFLSGGTSLYQLCTMHIKRHMKYKHSCEPVSDGD